VVGIVLAKLRNGGVFEAGEGEALATCSRANDVLVSDHVSDQHHERLFRGEFRDRDGSAREAGPLIHLLVQNAVKEEPAFREWPVQRGNNLLLAELGEASALNVQLQVTAPVEVIRPIRFWVGLVSMDLCIVVSDESLDTRGQFVAVPVSDNAVSICSDAESP